MSTYSRIPDNQLVGETAAPGVKWYEIPHPGSHRDFAIARVHYDRSARGYAVKVSLSVMESVLGRYPTPVAALEAAEMYLSVRGTDRLCTIRDIDAARKERAKLTAKSLAPASARTSGTGGAG